MNILNMIQEQLTPQLLNQTSAAVGENPEATKTAMCTALPAILAKFVGEATSGKGATGILNLLNQAKPQGGWAEDASATLGSLNGAGGPDSRPGNTLISSLLGSKAPAVADFIANKSGVKTSSAMSILGLAGSLVMGTLGKLVSSQGLGASSLGQLLRSQASHLGSVLPPGLADTLGTGNVIGASGDAARAAAAGAQKTAAGAVDGARAGSERVAGAIRSPGVLRWAWIPVLALVAGWLAFHQMRKSERAMGGGGDQTYSATQNRPQLNVAGLQSLNLQSESDADRLAKTISAGDFSRPVELSDMAFDSGGELTQDAQRRLGEVATVIRAVPGVKVTITAFGNSTDDGLARASEIKSSLIGKGAPPDRIEVKGSQGSGSPQLSLSK